ncbi:tropomodulin-1-like isoform X1 [Branchiostoma floridae x Branchiostoma belcheri]
MAGLIKFGLGEDLEKYRDVDEDAILSSMTEEELEALNAELDPDNDLLPVGLRQHDQTKKSPTGRFDREHLLKYLEKSAREHKDREDLIPFTGEKKGKAYVKKEVKDEDEGDEPILDPELEEALKEATDGELCDLAAILGMHTLMSNDQYYASLASGEIANKEGFRSVVKCTAYPQVQSEPPNTTDPHESLAKLQDNDSDLTDLNLNNIKNIAIPTLGDICSSLANNTNLKYLSMASTRSNDKVAQALADGLKENTTLERLNIESNFISGDGMKLIMEAVVNHPTLTEIRIANQRHSLGNSCEMAIADMLRKNRVVLKFGYSFEVPGPRDSADHSLTRNNDLVRRRRLGLPTEDLEEEEDQE